MDAMNRELPHPDEPLEEPEEPLDEPSQAPARADAIEQRPEPVQATYDGSWIDACESISDVIDSLGSVSGSIEDVRSTIALYVVPFSDELASVIKTARNRDELELMLRRALTETIDDAFERTAIRFAQEQETFEQEATRAAESFDRSFKDVRAAAKPVPIEEPVDEQALEPGLDQEAVPEDAAEVARRLHEMHMSIEQKSAPGPAPAPRPIPRPETFTQSMNTIMSGIQGLVETGDYDAALERVSNARELLARQIRIRTTRGDPIIDETMADYELKSLALDLEILKSRE